MEDREDDFHAIILDDEKWLALSTAILLDDNIPDVVLHQVYVYKRRHFQVILEDGEYIIETLNN